MNNIKHPQLAFVLGLSLLFSGWASAGLDYDGLVIFGDSLSDPGNKYVVTGLSNTPPYDLLDPFLVPDGPYSRGGHHHSNGQTWVEQYAKPLGLGGLVRPALRNPGKATNYAYGGARARDASASSPNMHLPMQVTTFLADTGGVASPDALYVIFIGGNDIAPDAVFAFVSSPLDGLTIIGEAVGSIGGAIQTLYTHGARKFLVMNSPDLGFTPSLAIADQQFPGAAGLASCLSYWFNFGYAVQDPQPSGCPLLPVNIPGLDDVLDTLEAAIPDPDLEIIRYDVYTRFLQLVLDPLPSDPQNGEVPCVTPNVPPYACKKPDNYVFWDGVHPTKAVHGIIANEMDMLLAE
ncbi:MAG: SGNH/GDSL hydrolase family protein [Gammaproteobacteria bacterium]